MGTNLSAIAGGLSGLANSQEYLRNRDLRENQINQNMRIQQAQNAGLEDQNALRDRLKGYLGFQSPSTLADASTGQSSPVAQPTLADAGTAAQPSASGSPTLADAPATNTAKAPDDLTQAKTVLGKLDQARYKALQANDTQAWDILSAQAAKVRTGLSLQLGQRALSQFQATGDLNAFIPALSFGGGDGVQWDSAQKSSDGSITLSGTSHGKPFSKTFAAKDGTDGTAQALQWMKDYLDPNAAMQRAQQVAAVELEVWKEGQIAKAKESAKNLAPQTLSPGSTLVSGGQTYTAPTQDNFTALPENSAGIINKRTGQVISTGTSGGVSTKDLKDLNTLVNDYQENYTTDPFNPTTVDGKKNSDSVGGKAIFNVAHNLVSNGYGVARAMTETLPLYNQATQVVNTNAKTLTTKLFDSDGKLVSSLADPSGKTVKTTDYLASLGYDPKSIKSPSDFQSQYRARNLEPTMYQIASGGGQPAGGQAPQRDTSVDPSTYGPRVDGTQKGTGFLGPLKMQDGSGKVATEISIGVNIDGKETEIPTLVPTLSQQEVNYLLQGNKPTQAIIDKAVSFARQRISQGQSPFANSGQSASSSSASSGTKQQDMYDRWIKAKNQIELLKKQASKMSPGNADVFLANRLPELEQAVKDNEDYLNAK